jgi:hypothetical protein
VDVFFRAIDDVKLPAKLSQGPAEVREETRFKRVVRKGLRPFVE